jgi:hypothetical protein
MVRSSDSTQTAVALRDTIYVHGAAERDIAEAQRLQDTLVIALSHIYCDRLYQR